MTWFFKPQNSLKSQKKSTILEKTLRYTPTTFDAQEKQKLKSREVRDKGWKKKLSLLQANFAKKHFRNHMGSKNYEILFTKIF